MTLPRLGIIVFARTSSHRLPGKVLMDFCGRPLLAHIIERANALGQQVIVATSLEPDDAPVAEMAAMCGAASFRGPLDDVLQRAVTCAQHYRLDAFARLCGDRPYFPQDTMRAALAAMARAYDSGVRIDLVTNHLPVGPPAGLSTEVVLVDALERALAAGPSPRQREHLTSYLYDDASSFVIRPVAADFTGTRAHRYAVDTAEDYDRLSRVACTLNDLHATPEAVAQVFDASVARPAN